MLSSNKWCVGFDHLCPSSNKVFLSSNQRRTSSNQHHGSQQTHLSVHVQQTTISLQLFIKKDST